MTAPDLALVRIGPGAFEVHVGEHRVGSVIRRVAGRGHLWMATRDGRYVGRHPTPSGAAALLLEDDGPER